MKSVGVIAEFNPFHLGHKYLIEKTSALVQADVCVSVMSGNFVQRGGPACFDKYYRAEEALANGFDLVVEMPQVYALGNAGYFGEAGVRTLNALGCDYISFGSEAGNVEVLFEMEDALIKLEDENSTLIKEELKKGLSYPAARLEALKRINPNLDFDSFKEPNNILALEYLRAIKLGNLSINPVTVPREKGDHIHTASWLREKLFDDESTGPLLRAMEGRYFDLIKYNILGKNADELDAFDSSEEGLGNKLKKEIRKASSLEEFISAVSGKRYTYTRVSRLLSHIVLGITPEMQKQNIVYIRPLAMNEKGSALLREAKNKDVIVVNDPARELKYSDDECLKDFLKVDIKAQDIYNILAGEELYEKSEFVRRPKVLQTNGN